MSWANSFVGVPFVDLGRELDGCDCWGLARLVYRMRLGIELPSYADAYSSASESAEVCDLLNQHRESHWQAVTSDVRAYDLLLFRRGGHDSHIGIAIDDRHMLHMASGDHAKIECYNAPRWKTRLVGVFGHAHGPYKRGVK